MKNGTELLAQWLFFCYIIRAIFGRVFFKGISLPFFKYKRIISIIEA